MVNKVNVANVANVAANYQLHGTELKNSLTETDTTAYISWKWAVKKKLRIDIIIYSTKTNCVSYTFNQLTQLIFQQLKVWIHTNLKNLTIVEFFDKIEHYMGISMFATAAKQNFNTITMKSTKTINEYYHRLFKL